MKFIKKSRINFLIEDTSISNIFINDILPITKPEYVSVYLYAYMYSNLDEYIITNDDIARELSIDISVVLSAWDDLQKKGVVKKHEIEGNATDFNVEFLNLKESVFSAVETGVQTGDKKTADATIEKMFDEIAKIKGKPLSTIEAKKIATLLEDMPAEKILLAYNVVKTTKKDVPVSYIESILYSWQGKGLQTVADIKAHIEDDDKKNLLYNSIGKLLSMYPPFNDEEKRVFDMWTDEYGYDYSMIEGLAKKAAGKKNKFAYVAKIIETEVGDLKKKGANKAGQTSTARSLNERQRYYENARKKDEEEMRKRKEKVFNQIPEIKTIEQNIKNKYVELSDLFVSKAANKNKKISDTKTIIEDLENKKTKLLENAGYAPNYLDEVFLCQKCKDTGLLENGGRCDCFLEK